MPFIKQERRAIIDAQGLAGLAVIELGDRCYVHYRNMVEDWKASPKWTTAHSIYHDVMLTGTQFGVTDDALAKELAWQVFFQLHVMPYELKKQEENGDI